MVKRIAKILILFIYTFILCGCWDYGDINNRGITLSIGIDLDKQNSILISGEFAKLATSSKESKEHAKSANSYVVTAYGKTFEESRVNLDSVNPYPTFLGATRVVLFGKTFAQDNIEPYISRIDKFPDYRKTLLAVVSREPAKELLDFGTDKDISVGFLIENIMYKLKKRGLGIYPNIGEILSEISMEKVGFLLPYVGIENGDIKYLGLAVMKDSKLEGIIDITDTDGILYVLSDKPQLTEEILSRTGDETSENSELADHHEPESGKHKNKYSFKTYVKKRKIKTDFIDEKVTINIDLDIDASLEYQFFREKISDDKLKQMENTLSEKIKGEIKKEIYSSQNEFKTDFYGFAKYFRGSHPKIYKELDWKKAYLDAEIKVNVKTKIINYNLLDPNAKKKK